MADFAAIQQLLARYCYAHDEQDTETLVTCFAEEFEFMGAKGPAAAVEIFKAGYRQMSIKRRHVITNSFLLEDGEERAVVQSYITLYLIKEGALSLHLTGVYRDTVVLEGGAWRIAKRDASMDVEYNPGDVVPAAVVAGAQQR